MLAEFLDENKSATEIQAMEKAAMSTSGGEDWPKAGYVIMV